MPKSLRPPGPSFDVERAIGRVPETAHTKGVFFAPLRAELGSRFDDLASRLLAPPRGGRYLPFGDYPSRDHIRLIDATATERYPHLPAREAHRRLGRESFGEFARSTFGRVVLGLFLGDVAGAMTRFGEGYARLVKGTRPVRSSPTSDGGVLLVFEDPIPIPEYVVGIVEAIIEQGGREPRVSVSEEENETRMDVHWTAHP